MTTHRRLTLEETIQAARRQGEIDEIIQKTLAMSDDEIARELEADGVDVSELDERLAARGKELFAVPGEQSEDPPQAGRQPEGHSGAARRRNVPRTAIAFGAGVGTTAAVLAALAGAGVITTTGTAPLETTGNPPPLTPARKLRSEAFEACGRGHWQQCIDRFNEARTLDPAGDTDPDVVDARKRATAMIEHR